jgi:ribosomal protein S15P/S13E
VKHIRDTRLELDQNTSDYIENKTRFDQETQRFKMLEYLKDKNLKEAESAIKVIKTDKIK